MFWKVKTLQIKFNQHLSNAMVLGNGRFSNARNRIVSNITLFRKTAKVPHFFLERFLEERRPRRAARVEMLSLHKYRALEHPLWPTTKIIKLQIFLIIHRPEFPSCANYFQRLLILPRLSRPWKETTG
jgi:hypothetical protein